MDGLFGTLPWHTGFSNEVGDRLHPSGDWHPERK